MQVKYNKKIYTLYAQQKRNKIIIKLIDNNNNVKIFKKEVVQND